MEVERTTLAVSDSLRQIPGVRVFGAHIGRARQGEEVAGLHFGDKADPDTLDRTASARDEERVRAWLRRRMPLANGERRDAKVCMYTNTHDANFIVDRLADDPNVVVASACSGHGFKFSSVIGEILADLVLDGETRHPIGFLSADRLVRG